MIGRLSDEIDLVSARAKLAAMSEAELLACGTSMRNLVYPREYAGGKGKPTVGSCSTQLDEARAEWRHRHPKPFDVEALC
jgi:hypothetical protein